MSIEKLMPREVLEKYSKERKENVAWESDEPTPFVVAVVEDGLIGEDDRVVDIGCGFGRNANYLAEQGADVTAVNINPEELETARKKAEARGVSVDYILSDATDLPYADGSFDVAFDLGCSHMLPTKEGQMKAADEVARVIKSGGKLIYFGFSKSHPAAKLESKPMFRDIEDIEELYGHDFEILKTEEISWVPSSEEEADVSEHKGLNIIMQRKSEKQ